MDPVQKNFMIALAAFIFVSCMAITAILGISWYIQPATSGNGTSAGGNSNLTHLVVPNGTYNNSYTTGILANISGNGSNMTQEEIVAARDKIKEENAVSITAAKLVYGLNDEEINGAIDTYLRGGRSAGYDYLINLSSKHPGISDAIKKYNESGGNISAIFGG